MKQGHFVLTKGQKLHEVEYPPVTRHTLALFGGGSGDHNPLHTDIDFARASGHDDVIAHGMLIMSFLSRYLTDQFPQKSLRDFQVRFHAISHVRDRISCGGEIVDIQYIPGGRQASLKLWARNQDNEVKLSGSASLSIDLQEAQDG